MKKIYNEGTSASSGTETDISHSSSKLKQPIGTSGNHVEIKEIKYTSNTFSLSGFGLENSELWRMILISKEHYLILAIASFFAYLFTSVLYLRIILIPIFILFLLLTRSFTKENKNEPRN